MDTFEHFGLWSFFPGDVAQSCQRPILVHHAGFIFTVSNSLRFHFDHVSTDYDDVDWIRVRVVGERGRARKIDPSVVLQQVHSWCLWIREGGPLSSLSWDLAEWCWPVFCSEDTPVSFFEYSARIGHRLLLRQLHTIHTRMRSWLHVSLSHAFLTQFWQHTWPARISRGIMYFMWMLAHTGLVVGNWAAQIGHDPTCLRCDWQLSESPQHCLWMCSSLQPVWRSICFLLAQIGAKDGFVTWGAVSWLLQFSGPWFMRKRQQIYLC